jgi:myo-inositol-1(or 4)-monophosphatase
MDYEMYCKETCGIVKKTGQFIKNELGKVRDHQIEDKDKNSLVSYVDKQAEISLVQELGALLPEASFITEEETVENRASGLEWIIDPLDGTTNFLHGIPHFAVSVALAVEGQLVLGVILDVCKDEIYYAWQGGGAYTNGKSIQVSTTKKLVHSIVATGFPYRIPDHEIVMQTFSHFVRDARGIRRWGAAALDLAFVACGRFDAYYEDNLNSWDIAAGAIIVEEAGGHVTDFSNGKDYLQRKQIIASNGAIHQEVTDIVQRYFTPSYKESMS